MLGLVINFLQARKGFKAFKAIPRPQRQMVFYSEGSGYWSHFEPVFLALRSAGQPVLYVTSSLHDPVYQNPPQGTQVFYVGSGMVRTLFFATLDVDVLLMTMPDLQTFHIKRSPHRVHYAYLQHSIVSTHMVYRPAAFDHFDSVFCVGPHHVQEIRKREEQQQLPAKILLEHGYGRLDGMLNKIASTGAEQKRSVLIAPSWGDSSLLNLCGIELIDNLVQGGHEVVLRPHPRSRQLNPQVLHAIEQRFGGQPGFSLDENMDAHSSLAAAGVMISDWSGAALEFAFAYQRPVLFIDVPRKVQNPEYTGLGLEPLEASIRSEIGQILEPNELTRASHLVAQMLDNTQLWQEQILAARAQHVFNPGSSGTVAANFLLQQLANTKEQSQ